MRMGIKPSTGLSRPDKHQWVGPARCERDKVMTGSLDSRNECDTPPEHVHARTYGEEMTGEDPTDVRSYLLDRRAFRDDRWE